MDTRCGNSDNFQMTRILILIALALLQTLLLLSGKISLYLSPSMAPFFIFSTAAFYILAIHELWFFVSEVNAENHEDARKRSFSASGGITVIALFGLVLAAGFFLPHRVLDSRVADKKGISLQRVPAERFLDPRTAPLVFPEDHVFYDDAKGKGFQAGGRQDSEPDEQRMLRSELGIWYDNELYISMAEDLLSRDSLKITGKSFLDDVLILSVYLDAFIGRDVEFTGFVYHDGTMAENELAVARIALTCCLADATVYGLLVRPPDLPRPENDVWVRVTGRIDKTRDIENPFPLILAEQMEPVHAPAQPYVFPRLYGKFVFGIPVD